MPATDRTNSREPIARACGRLVVGRALRDTFDAQLDDAEALLAAPRNRELRAARTARLTSLTRAQCVRIGLATGVYQTVLHDPWVAIATVGAVVVWCAYVIALLVRHL